MKSALYYEWLYSGPSNSCGLKGLKDPGTVMVGPLLPYALCDVNCGEAMCIHELAAEGSRGFNSLGPC